MRCFSTVNRRNIAATRSCDALKSLRASESRACASGKRRGLPWNPPSFAITAKHYVDPDTLRNSTVRRVASALTTPANPDEESAQLLERLRNLPAEVRSALLRAVAAETAN